MKQSDSTVLIGIDLGTTVCRSMVLDSDQRCLAQDQAEYPLHRISARRYEQDARQWWTVVRDVLVKSIAGSGVPAEAVGAIGISSQGISFVPVDASLEPLRPAITWLDTRATGQLQEVRRSFTEAEVFARTGKRLSEAYVLPKLLWLRDNEPEVYSKTSKFLMAHDYLAARLTGNSLTDHSLAGGTLLHDLSGRDWWDEGLSAFGIRREVLPSLQWAGARAGMIKAHVADEIGLSRNTLVAVGGQDQKCAALGAGLRTGVAAVSLGTAAAVTTRHRKPILDDAMRIPCFSDVLTEHWVLEGVIGTACASLDWARRSLFSAKSYAELDAIVSSTPADLEQAMFFPHLAGAGSPWWDSGMQGAFAGITLFTTPAHMLRSVYEGVAYEIVANVDTMEQLAGPVRSLRLFGGGSRSDVWCQMIADAAGRTVEVPQINECAAAGAAMLAGKAAGLFDDIEQAAGRMKLRKTFEPDTGSSSYYRQRYEAYMERQARLLSPKGESS